jgi:hypothetical protein
VLALMHAVRSSFWQHVLGGFISMLQICFRVIPASSLSHAGFFSNEPRFEHLSVGGCVWRLSVSGCDWLVWLGEIGGEYWQDCGNVIIQNEQNRCDEKNPMMFRWLWVVKTEEGKEMKFFTENGAQHCGKGCEWRLRREKNMKIVRSVAIKICQFEILQFLTICQFSIPNVFNVNKGGRFAFSTKKASL